MMVTGGYKPINIAGGTTLQIQDKSTSFDAFSNILRCLKQKHMINHGSPHPMDGLISKEKTYPSM